MGGLARLPKVITLAEANHIFPEIARILLSGGVIAVPTDTIYGLACCSLSTRGIDRIYQIKGRDAAKPMAICLDKAISLPQWSNTEGIETNVSGQKSTLSPDEFSDLWSQLDLVVDGGRIGGDGSGDESVISRAGSTVVDLSPAVRSRGQRLHYRILRDGRQLRWFRVNEASLIIR
ncbi:YrdC domain-containing protein, mitochondrial [Echinococcus granulosus]|nr:YrdC domain-containing protein, mitochondrial [Echinococcus granulosus]